MKRIWFNHWFSTAYHIINLVKNNDKEKFYIIGSSPNEESVIKLSCDEWYKEPSDSEDYINFALDFCKKHHIDVFIPRREMEVISKNISNFNKIKTKVLIENNDIINLLNDKAKTYNYLKDINNIHIPRYEICNTAIEFEQKFSYFNDNHIDVCVKLVKDEGAKSFRRIINEPLSIDKIKSYSQCRISFKDYLECLKTVVNFEDLMLIEYLPGNEISVDCLNTKQGLIAIPRFKSNTRSEYIKFNNEIIKICEDIINKIGIKYPCNIQFKIKNNIPYLLEINPRMSGGIQLSCLSCNVNIPNIAVNKLLEINKEWTIDKTPHTLSYIETPKIIE